PETSLDGLSAHRGRTERLRPRKIYSPARTGCAPFCNSPRACVITFHALLRPRDAITAATAMSGQCEPVNQTPHAARITATFAIASLRVQSQTDIRLLSPFRCRKS